MSISISPKGCLPFWLNLAYWFACFLLLLLLLFRKRFISKSLLTSCDYCSTNNVSKSLLTQSCWVSCLSSATSSCVNFFVVCLVPGRSRQLMHLFFSLTPNAQCSIYRHIFTNFLNDWIFPYLLVILLLLKIWRKGDMRIIIILTLITTILFQKTSWDKQGTVRRGATAPQEEVTFWHSMGGYSNTPLSSSYPNTVFTLILNAYVLAATVKIVIFLQFLLCILILFLCVGLYLLLFCLCARHRKLFYMLLPLDL